MRIVSLDPGGTTGYAVWHDMNDVDDWNAGHIGPSEHHIELWGLLDRYSPNLVICEGFNYQRREVDRGVSLSLVSKEYIGITKMWCKMRKKEYLEPPPGQAKQLVSDNYLKSMSPSLFLPGKKHANDAMRQLVYYLVNKKARRDLIPKVRL